MVVFPFVPVTPIMRSSALGSPKKRAAIGAIAARESGTTSCGTARSSSRSTTSATAPASTTAGAKSWPSAVLPRTQKNSVPGPTLAAVEGNVGDLAIGPPSGDPRLPVRQRVA